MCIVYSCNNHKRYKVCINISVLNIFNLVAGREASLTLMQETGAGVQSQTCN